MTPEDYILREKHTKTLLDYCRKENEKMWSNVAKAFIERYELKHKKED